METAATTIPYVDWVEAQMFERYKQAAQRADSLEESILSGIYVFVPCMGTELPESLHREFAEYAARRTIKNIAYDAWRPWWKRVRNGDYPYD